MKYRIKFQVFGTLIGILEFSIEIEAFDRTHADTVARYIGEAWFHGQFNYMIEEV